VDTVSCTNLVISVGVAVDYSAHVAHAFLAEGERKKRGIFAFAGPPQEIYLAPKEEVAFDRDCGGGRGRVRVRGHEG